MRQQGLTEDEVIGYMDSLGNWGRWGPDDQLGIINLITPEKRSQAARLVQEGITVSCSSPVTTKLAPDVHVQPQHFMLASGEAAASGRIPYGDGSALDYIGAASYGFTVTPIDSLSHAFWNGKMYNGRSAARVTTREGATVESIEVLKEGVVTGGVLLDIAPVHDREWLEVRRSSRRTWRRLR